MPITKYPANIKVPKGSIPHPALLQVVEVSVFHCTFTFMHLNSCCLLDPLLKIIFIFQRNADVVEYTSTFWRIKSDNEPKAVQPYLLFSTDDMNEGEFYLKANDLTIHVGNLALKAFSILLKYHHVFDVDYDADLLHLYVFMEYLLGLPGAKDKITPKMDEFLTALRNF